MYANTVYFIHCARISECCLTRVCVRVRFQHPICVCPIFSRSSAK